MKERKAQRLAVAFIISIYYLISPFLAQAESSGFRVRKPNGDPLPGAVSFTPRAPGGKASSIISQAQSRGESGRLLSLFPRYAQNEIRDALREGTPEHAITLREYAEFKVAGYAKSVGAVVMRVESRNEISGSYRYVGVLAVIYPDGSVDWHTMDAKIYSTNVFAVTIGSALCSTLSKEGRSAVLMIIGESYRWW
ncbi:MAG: hypothetical protein LBH66_04420 [Oscillospiraceae bacterium]|jgi:hypothetical protein|nr:hypothetical protein [Oscillospiraceae bacterium]